MDVAYDHIQEEALSPEDAPKEAETTPHRDLNAEVKEAYTAISASPWGMKLGGFLSQVKKQVSHLHVISTSVLPCGAYSSVVFLP